MRKLLTFILISVAALAATGYGLSLYLDETNIKRELEAGLEKALDRPVDLGRVRISWLPRPALDVAEIRIAMPDSAAPLVIGELQAALEVAALIEGKWVIPAITIRDVVLAEDQYAELRAMVAGGPDAESAPAALLPVQLHEIRLERVTWMAGPRRLFGPFNADIALSESMRPGEVRITGVGNDFMLRLAWQGQLIQVEALARDRLPIPARDMPAFDELWFRGKLYDSRLIVEEGTLRRPGGRLQLQGRLDWEEEVSIEADVQVTELDLATLKPWIAAPPPGRLETGTCRLHARAADWSGLRHRQQLECDADYARRGRSAPVVFRIAREPAGVEFDFQASDLTLPRGPALHFAELHLRGNYAAGQLRIDSFEGRAYGGELKGRARLEWTDDWELVFASDTRKLDLAPVLAALDYDGLAGRLDSECRGSLSGADFASLGQARDVACRIRIEDGVIRKTDLEKAATLRAEDAQVEGETPFARCQGDFRHTQDETLLSNVEITSEALEATGDVLVSGDETLQGEVKVSLNRTAGVVGVPLKVGGTVGEPSVRPTNAVMAGGAAGTVMLGPGVGTAIGVKVGEMFGKLGKLLSGDDKPASRAPVQKGPSVSVD